MADGLLLACFDHRGSITMLTRVLGLHMVHCSLCHHAVWDEDESTAIRKWNRVQTQLRNQATMATEAHPIKVKFCLKEDCPCDGHLEQLRGLVMDEIKMILNDLNDKEKAQIYHYLHYTHQCRI